MDVTEIDCPRCGHRVAARFYGPCEECREQLRQTQRLEPSTAPGETAAFEPKMNVTPNAVALKDD
jgi:hypothetical protein